jgi:formylglycine-generating enzyme
MNKTTQNFTRMPTEFPPRWAQSYGDDIYGLWANLAFGPMQTPQAVTQRFRWMEPGSFLMGSTEDEVNKITSTDIREYARHEIPKHLVNITEGFWLADTPCIEAIWAIHGGREDKPNKPSSMSKPTADLPITNVSWDDVQRFLTSLNNMLPSGIEAVLPSEAQWEYSCRAGTQTAYWWGDAEDTTRMNVAANRSGVTPVKLFPASPWGLHDMHGNVWEWCADKGLRDYTLQALQNPVEIDEKTPVRVLRSSAWNHHPAHARAPYRYAIHRDNGWNYSGFRLALRSNKLVG